MTDALIDHHKPLEDASEVYGPTIHAKTGFRVEDAHFTLDTDDRPVADVFVEDIFKGDVALHVGAEQSGTEFNTHVSLDAEAARQLGNVLLRAAAYADKHSVEED